MSHKRTPNYKCVVCSKDMYVRPSAMAKSAGWGFTCSKQCGIDNRSKHTVGLANHQYGLKGDKNASFKGDTKISRFGYVLKYMPNHSRANHAGYVFEHNLIMEEYLGRPLKFLGYKNPNNEVCHHKDRNKQNNSIDNLELMLDKEHAALHHREGDYRRDTKGRIIKNGK